MDRFDGAWEEKGVIGPRVEIQGSKMIRLWQSTPVLETDFEVVDQDGKTVLQLEHNGLRNSGSLDAYSVIKECYYDGAALVFVEDYRFSGETVLKLYPTSNSRYGNVTLVDKQVLPLLQGRWESKYTDLVFKGNMMSICGNGRQQADEVFEIVAAKSNNSDNSEIKILNKDPAEKRLGMFYSIEFTNDQIYAYIGVCDAKPIRVVFSRQE